MFKSAQRWLNKRWDLLAARIRRPSDNTRLLLLAVAVGLTTGIGVWIFRAAIDLFHDLFAVKLNAGLLTPIVGPFGIVITLAVGGLIVGWIIHRFVGEERHHGVAIIIESVALAGGRLRYALAPFKALGSAISLGAGASLGPEAPSVMIGANIGSFAGQKLRLSEEKMRLLVAGGAAAAIAAAFRAPIAGVFFALEVVMNGEFTTGSFAAVVVAAVTSSAFMGLVEEGGAEFGQLTYTLGSPAELIFYALLGILLGPVSVLFIRVVHGQHEWWKHHVHLSPMLKTALAGVLVGIVGIFLPQILGPGREVIADILNDRVQFALGLMLILALAKMLTNAVSIAGGFVGGVFAPTLFVGAMLGSFFGKIVTAIVPVELAGTAPAYAIAGMAAVMAGVVRAPITAVLLAFELTNDYRLIVPIMFTTVICVYITERYIPAGIDMLSLHLSGVRLQQGRDIDVMQGINVREIMQTPAPTIIESATLTELRDTLRRLHTRAVCVIDRTGNLQGIVTLTDLQRAFEAQQNGAVVKVRDICTHDLHTAEPDDALWVAIQTMSNEDVGQLPVLHPRTQELMGMIARNDILHAYSLAIARKREYQQKVEQIRLGNLTGAHVLEMHVGAGAALAGQQISAIQWPPESLVASIRRQNRLIVPHGSTEFHAGDVVTVVAAREAEAPIARLFGYETEEAIG